MEFLMQPISRFRILEGMDGTDRPPEPGEYAVPAIESGAPSTPTMEVEAAGGDTQAQLVVAALGPPAASQQATGKVNPEAPEWKKRVRVGSAAPGRTPCPTRASALENAIRSFADNPGDEVTVPKLGTSFNSLKRPMTFTMCSHGRRDLV
ncbi:uncharacterized protein [Aegilops tauschii subsp. strangulata]|nr:uncharacterized protein LOC120968062 [Aegilops tauschii subsp. strangulata]XP_044437283.1 uncharacterized protein LOC123163942 [Triticum aestivum]